MIIQIEPWIDDEEKQQLLRVIDSTFVTENQLTKEFEDKIKQLTGSKHAISMTNGTAALYCCLLSLGIGKGDEVIVPDLTFIATSNSVIWTGATPIFCDVDESGCLDPQKVKNLINSKTKAIVPVHLYGNSADTKTLRKICDENGIFLIEDGAQAVGVLQSGKHVVTDGHCGILSFYGNKTITCGEGGIVLTDEDEIAKSCYRLKNHGRDMKGSFVHTHVGYNFSFTEMQAAIGIAQLGKLQRVKEKKKVIHDRYVEVLSDIPDIRFQEFRKGCEPVHWFTSFFTAKKKELKQFMLEREIQTRDFFLPLHRQPCYSEMISKNESYTISDEMYETGISLPSSYGLSSEQQDIVIKEIRNFYEK